MKFLIGLGAALIGILALEPTQAADIESSDIFQKTVTVTLPANFQGDARTFVSIPVTKRLVIKTLTVVGRSGRTGSTARVSIDTTIFDSPATLIAGDVYFDSLQYPSSTLSTTFYAGAGSHVYLHTSRPADNSSDPMTVDVTITGYYVPKPLT